MTSHDYQMARNMENSTRDKKIKQTTKKLNKPYKNYIDHIKMKQTINKLNRP